MQRVTRKQHTKNEVRRVIAVLRPLHVQEFHL